MRKKKCYKFIKITAESPYMREVSEASVWVNYS